MMKYNIKNLFYIVKLKLKLLIFPTLTKYIDNKQMINRNYQCPTLSKAQNCHSQSLKNVSIKQIIIITLVIKHQLGLRFHLPLIIIAYVYRMSDSIFSKYL